MTQKEFEEKTGISITGPEFDRVHDIYMACGEYTDKDRFCSLWKDGEFRELLHIVTLEQKVTREAYDMAMNKIKEQQEQMELENKETVELLLCKANAYKDTDFYNLAVNMVGKKEVVLTKLRMGLAMWEEDIKYINRNLE